MLIVNDKIEIPLSEINFTYARSSGPGGQNVNKVDSKAFLRWNVRKSRFIPLEVMLRFIKTFKNRVNEEGEVILSSESFRDQARNQSACLEKLKSMILSVYNVPKARVPTKKSYSQKQKNLNEKKAHGAKKQFRKRLNSFDD